MSAARQSRPETAPAAAANVAWAASAAFALAPATLVTKTEGDGACEAEGDADADAVTMPVALFEGRAAGWEAPALREREAESSAGRNADAEDELLRVALPVTEVKNGERVGSSSVDADGDPDPLGELEALTDPVADPDPDALPEALALPLTVAVCDGVDKAERIGDEVSEDEPVDARVTEELCETVDFCDWLEGTTRDALGVTVGDGDAEGALAPQSLGVGL